MALVAPDSQLVKVITSEPSTTASTSDLLSVIYTRVKKDSPEYNSVYEAIDQSVDVRISTIVFHAAPEPIISLYDFIVTTFTSSAGISSTSSPVDPTPRDLSQPADEAKTRVVVKLESVRGRILLLSLRFYDITDHPFLTVELINE